MGGDARGAGTGRAVPVGVNALRQVAPCLRQVRHGATQHDHPRARAKCALGVWGDMAHPKLAEGHGAMSFIRARTPPPRAPCPPADQLPDRSYPQPPRNHHQYAIIPNTLKVYANEHNEHAP